MIDIEKLLSRAFSSSLACHVSAMKITKPETITGLWYLAWTTNERNKKNTVVAIQLQEQIAQNRHNLPQEVPGLILKHLVHLMNTVIELPTGKAWHKAVAHGRSTPEVRVSSANPNAKCREQSPEMVTKIVAVCSCKQIKESPSDR